MNAAERWISARRTLGLALFLGIAPAWAGPTAEALATRPPFAHAREAADTAGCGATGGPSTIAFSESPGQATRNCAVPSGSPVVPPPPGYRGRRLAEPAAGTFPRRPSDTRRYSF